MRSDNQKRFMRHLANFFMLTSGLVASCTVFAADIAITSVGQSSDGMMAKVLMNKLNRDADYDSILSARQLSAKKAIIAVVGASAKGLGAAGITKEEEKARSRALLQEAKKRGIKVLVMHIGGDRRRGELTDAFIEAVAGFADRLIVVKSGNVDGIFSKTMPSTAKLAEVDTVQATAPVLEATLRDWGLPR